MSETVISRKEAADQGIRFYYTGKPCKNGHVTQRTVSNAECTSCAREKYARYRKANSDKVKEREKAYREKHREQRASYCRDWHEKNREYSRASARAMYQANRDRQIKSAKSWKKANKERALQIQRQWSATNREKTRLYAARRRAALMGSDGHFTEEDVARIFRHQRGRCAVCRIKLCENYHRDHIIALSKGGSNAASNIQILCVTCNCTKKDADPIEFMQSRGLLL